MRETWRWFGPPDPITLAEVRQTGAKGIVSALHHVPSGIAWVRRRGRGPQGRDRGGGPDLGRDREHPGIGGDQDRHGAVAGPCGGLDRQPARGGGGRRPAGDLLQLHAGAGLDPHRPAASRRGRRHGDAFRPDGFRRVRSSPSASGRRGGGLPDDLRERAAIRAAALDPSRPRRWPRTSPPGCRGRPKAGRWTMCAPASPITRGWVPTTCAAT
jgi:hypothetical protein